MLLMGKMILLFCCNKTRQAPPEKEASKKLWPPRAASSSSPSDEWLWSGEKDALSLNRLGSNAFQQRAFSALWVRFSRLGWKDVENSF